MREVYTDGQTKGTLIFGSDDLGVGVGGKSGELKFAF
jgi:hypothetical protein